MRTILAYIFLLTAIFQHATSFHFGLHCSALNQCVCRTGRGTEIQDSMLKRPPHIRSSTKQSSLVLFKSTSDDDEDIQTGSSDKKKKQTLGDEVRRSLIISTILAGITNLAIDNIAPPGFKRVPIQWIAALGDPNSSSGNNAKQWGLWEKDPGPRGVLLKEFTSNVEDKKDDVLMPTGWVFSPNDWWLEEHGVVMEPPEFPVRPGRYLVTGGRLISTILTIDEFGGWKLENGKLYDVTHLPCRAARYRPSSSTQETGSPFTARQEDFPVKPGAEMPPVEGCEKQDYSVIFLIGMEK